MQHLSRTARPWGRSLILLLLVLPAIATPAPAASQQATPVAEVEIGAPPILEQAWGFVGQSQATAEQMTIAGRLTAVSGLAPAQLTVATDDETEPASRFTFVADLAIADTSSRGDTTTISGDGTLTIYLHDGSALDPNDPASFRAGLIVAEFIVRFQESVLRQAPQLGVVSGTMALGQTDSLTFGLDDVRYRFGHGGLGLALRYTGGLTAGPGDTATTAGVFGAAAVSGRAANPASTGEASAELSECEQLLAWIEATRARLAVATELRSAILGGAEITLEDLSRAATEVAALAEEQRDQAAPADAAAAEGLVLAALNTDARALELLVAAVEAGDEEAVRQAVPILNDGAALAERAMQTLDELAPVCDPPS